MIRRGPWFLAVAIAVLFTMGGQQGHAVVVVAVLASAAAFVAYVHPQLIYYSYAAALGLLPFGSVPGAGISLVLTLALGVWAAAVVHWDFSRKLGAIEWVVVGLIMASAVSVAVVRVSDADAQEFIKWVLATSTVFPLARLPSEQLVRLGKVYVVAAAVASTIAILTLLVLENRELLRPFEVFGYLGGESNVYVFSPEGKTRRLTGTFVNPNAAGVFLAIALALAAAHLRKLRGLLVIGIIAVALALSLSRSAIGGVAVSVVLLVVAHPMGLSRRGKMLAIVFCGLIGAVLTPAISNRLTNSFSASDYGSQARGRALADFPESLSGHWLFGLGWGRPEFLDPVAAVRTNFVANTPLLTTYRGGVIVGLMFVALLVFASARSWSSLQRLDWAPAASAAGFLGLAWVTLQLDFPVVTTPPLTAVFALLLAFVIRGPDVGQLAPVPAEVEALHRG